MIFRRKKPGAAGAGKESARDEAAPTAETRLPPLKSVARPGVFDGPAKPLAGGLPKAPAMPNIRASEAPRRLVDVPGAARKGDRPTPTEGKKLIVGREICLNGQISACERLVVEGRVEAELTDCRFIEIADTGTFKGSAEVDGAEISGRFEGSLTVNGRLLIRGTGNASGTVRYDRLEIEQGGEINGDVKSRAGTAAAAPRDAAQSDASSGSASPPGGDLRSPSAEKHGGLQGKPVGAGEL